MSSNGIMAGSGRKRITIIISAVLVFLLFVAFRPSSSSSEWPSTQGNSAGGGVAKAPVVPEGPPIPPSTQVPYPPSHDEVEHPGQDEPGAAATATPVPHQEHAGGAAPVTAGLPTASDDEICKTHVKMDDILVVMKTGATEAYDKLPIHFLTTLRCANDTIIFSDMDMEMGGHRIIDVLKDVKADIRKDNPDFELYDKLQQYHGLYADPRPLKTGDGRAWNLDKYKFNHMMLKTWEYNKEAPWYVFIEADTYVVWDNMRQLLDKYDPKKPWYMGSPTYLDIEFAHGGTGYVISNAAMKLAVGQHPDIADKFDKEVRAICCGDRQIAKILLEEDIRLTKAWPMFNGEKPLTLPYSEKHWCQPLLTMHHMTAQEVSQVWTLEQSRRLQGKDPVKEPLMIKDMYEHFVKANLESLSPPVREDWDNLATDYGYKPIKDTLVGLNDNKPFAELSEDQRASCESPQKCEALCNKQQDCFGWKHKDDECRLSKSIKVGGHMNPDRNKRFISGWNMDRIKKFTGGEDNCPNGPDWHVRGI